jgi:ABC-type transport system involved in Fe-S cluster assembly fused permease/ATPase subunit
MNYETVKAFNNEELERIRYNGILEKIKKNALKVQYTLANLNMG